MRALVAGGGIAGFTFAIAFRQQGGQVEIFEREPSLTAVGAGIVIHPNGMDVLHRLHLGDAVEAAGTVIRRLVVHEGPRHSVISLPEVWQHAGRPSVGLTRTSLQSVLADAYGDDGLALAHTVESFSATPDHVDVQLQSGVTRRGDVLVVADGARSALRARAGAPPPERTGLWYWRFCTAEPVVPADEWHSHTVTALLDGHRLSFGFIPVGQATTHVFVQLVGHEPPFSRPQEATDWLNAHAGALSADLAAALARRTGEVHFGPAYHSQAQVWNTSRVAFIGDASHALSPTFSEGASLGMEDAFVLADALSKAPVGLPLPRVLDSYAQCRTPRVSWAERMARHQINALRNPDPRPLRGAVTPVEALAYMRAMYGPLGADMPLVHYPADGASSQSRRMSA